MWPSSREAAEAPVREHDALRVARGPRGVDDLERIGRARRCGPRPARRAPRAPRAASRRRFTRRATGARRSSPVSRPNHEAEFGQRRADLLDRRQTVVGADQAAAARVAQEVDAASRRACAGRSARRRSPRSTPRSSSPRTPGGCASSARSARRARARARPAPPRSGWRSGADRRRSAPRPAAPSPRSKVRTSRSGFCSARTAIRSARIVSSRLRMPVSAFGRSGSRCWRPSPDPGMSRKSSVLSRGRTGV